MTRPNPNDPNVPESWLLAFALDDTAADFGWTPIGRMTSDREVSVTYKKDDRHSNRKIPSSKRDNKDS